MTTPHTPFQCNYSPEIADLMSQAGFSLMISTYQAGKVIILSPHQGGLIQLPRTFQKPMGLAVDQKRLAVATRHEVVVLINEPELARIHLQTPGKYDAFFAPRTRYLVNEVDLHDLRWSGETLWAVNTLFSCLCTIGPFHSFVPVWKPPFVSAYVPEDRCHLNGVAIVDGEPTYVTALGATDNRESWREDRLQGGVLVHVPSGEIVVGDLPMPHAPSMYSVDAFLLLSGVGELVQVDLEGGRIHTLARLPGYLRGMDRYGDFLFIGLSKQRPGRVLGEVPLMREELKAGVALFHIPSGRVVGMIEYLTDCQEIFDVRVLPGMRRPGLIGVDDDDLYLHAITTPGEVFWSHPLEETAEGDDGAGD